MTIVPENAKPFAAFDIGPLPKYAIHANPTATASSFAHGDHIVARIPDFPVFQGTVYGQTAGADVLVHRRGDDHRQLIKASPAHLELTEPGTWFAINYDEDLPEHSLAYQEARRAALTARLALFLVFALSCALLVHVVTS